MSAVHSTPQKQCSKCGLQQPHGNFCKKSRMHDGLNGQCKSCSAQNYRRYYDQHHAEMLERAKKDKANRPKPDPSIHREYWARNRAAIAARRKARYAVDTRLQQQNILRARKWVKDHLEEQRGKARAYYYRNRDAARKRVRAYEKANPEKVRWWGRLKANQRRARLAGAGGKYTATDVLKLYGLQHGKCANCREALNHKYHIDHRDPVSLGGSNHPHNLELLCPTCNMRKSAKLPHVFAQEQGRLL